MTRDRSDQIHAKAVQTRILALYDDFSELQDQWSFLCDAFTSIARLGEDIDEETLRGASIYADAVKERAAQTKAELKLVLDEVIILTKLVSSSNNKAH
jgi:hypothetical protein